MIDLPTYIPRRYRYKYTATLFAGSWRHSYDLVGSRGGVNVHFSGPHRYDGHDNWSAGIVFHYRSPPDYMTNDPPSHDKCWLLECPCWHDGSSLWAQEHFLPMFLQGDHTAIFRALVSAADEKFAVKCEEVSGQ